MRREKGGDRNGETGKGASGTVYLPGMAKRPSMQYMWNWNLVNVFTGWQHSQFVRLQMLSVVGWTGVEGGGVWGGVWGCGVE